MKFISTIIKHYPLVTYFVLAYLLTWVLLPLLLVNLALGVFGLLMPAVAAIVVAGVSEGKNGVKQLLRPLLIWRVHPIWCGGTGCSNLDAAQSPLSGKQTEVRR